MKVTTGHIEKLLGQAGITVPLAGIHEQTVAMLYEFDGGHGYKRMEATVVCGITSVESKPRLDPDDKREPSLELVLTAKSIGRLPFSRAVWEPELGAWKLEVDDREDFDLPGTAKITVLQG